MMYNYVKLDDETQIAFSGILEDNTIQVSAERPVDGGFLSASCFLPLCNWVKNDGFSREDLSFLSSFVKDNAPLIYRFSREAEKIYA